MQADDVKLIEPLQGEGEAALQANITKGEKILVKLEGWQGPTAFVVTDRRIYVLRCNINPASYAYSFNQVTGITITKRDDCGYVWVMTARSGDFFKAVNLVKFQLDTQGEAFQRGVSIARELVQKAFDVTMAHAVVQQSAADEIGKLAVLRDKGILTEEEFQAKKRQLLWL